MKLRQNIILIQLSLIVFYSGVFGQAESIFNPLFESKNDDINAFCRKGQVFITWTNSDQNGIRYNLYKSINPILYGSDLTSAQYMGSVRDNSAKNQRLTGILGETRYYKIDSAGTQLPDSAGLFVVTCMEEGSFYYAVTTSLNGTEDTTILPGSNSLTAPVNELIELPQPVWQETQTIQGRILDIYALFVSKAASPVYPQMTNEGSYAFHFAINRQGNTAPHPLTFYMRDAGHNFLENIWGIDDPDEWIVSIDDWLPNGQLPASLFYGYHEDFDIFSYNNPIPVDGMIYNYSGARVEYIVDWCLNNLPVDSTRTYMTGWSLGAIGVLMNSIMIPQNIAALHIYGPIFDGTYSPNNYLDQLYGTIASNLPTNEGYTRNQRLNFCYLISDKINTSLPLMFTFCGKEDINVGWAEKTVFYDTVNNTDHGGYHFWSRTDHFNTKTQWEPSFPEFSFFTRYRTDLSYPAFSNCSFNDNPGNGNPADGDSIGTINGYLDWKDDIVDSTYRWEITLFVKDLLTTQGTLTAPDSGLTDLTLRRLQKFSVPSGETIIWENHKNGIVIQQGSFAYSGNLITIPGMKVFKDSSRLKVYYSPVRIEDKGMTPEIFALEQNYPNPFNPGTKIKYSVPNSGRVIIKVYNILGKEIKTLINEDKTAGSYNITWYPEGLPSGVYIYRLRVVSTKRQEGSFSQCRKMILLK